MAGYVQAQDQVQAMVAQVKTLTVDKLKSVLRTEGLTVSGVKSELQIRTIAHIEKLRHAGDQFGLNRVRGNIRSLSTLSPYSHHDSLSPYPTPGSFTMSTKPSLTPSHLTFKPSPFYSIVRALSPVVECRVREATRDTVRTSFVLSRDEVEKLSLSKSYRIAVFCTAESLLSFGRESDVAFPHNVELKCNSIEVKANLRGLKNRPGSTRPADITHLVKKVAEEPNVVEMVYALTTKKFHWVVKLTHHKRIEALVSDLRRGKIISKEQVLREMRNKAEDPDITATSSILSLRDPVAYTRIETPCRSIACNHNQCFDAAAYLQLQEQAPTWTCPICNKPAPWENLAVDQYVNDILKSTPRATESVAVEPDGRWSLQKDGNASNRNSNPTPSDDDDDDDDDLVEIVGKPNPRPRPELLTPHSVKTPPLSSREDSTAPSASRTNKRSRSDVIDLTGSDDDDQPDPKHPRISDQSVRPRQDRYHFQLPPPGPSSYNFDSFNSSF